METKDLKDLEEKNPKAFDHFKQWFAKQYGDIFKLEMSIPHEIIYRTMYDYFDNNRIFISVKNKPRIGYNTFKVVVVCRHECAGIYTRIDVSEYNSRQKAEVIGFKNAFEILELNYNKLIRTCSNTPPL